MSGQCALARQEHRPNTSACQAGQRKGNVLCLALKIRKERQWWSLSSRKPLRAEGRPLTRAAVLDHVGLASIYVNVGDCSLKGQDGKNDRWLVKKWLVLFIKYCRSVLAFGDVVSPAEIQRAGACLVGEKD